MSERIAIFWPGDYRPRPNELAIPSITRATEQLEAALRKLGRASYRIAGFLTKPHEAIEKLGPVDDPLIGVFVHWVYGPHTTDGVVGKDNPLLLASNFSGQWPGLVGLLNTGACLESLGRASSRAWTSAEDWTADAGFMGRLEEWCRSGRIRYPEDELAYPAEMHRREAGATSSRSGHRRDAGATNPATDGATNRAWGVAEAIRRRRVLGLMLGDTSMGMINGYFGPRVLNGVGFSEHKVDQAWVIERGRGIEAKRIDAALAFVREKGVQFHWSEAGAEDFDENATREQLRDYLAVLDLVHEFKADCLGWQYQLGLLPLRPPSDFAEGLFNSACRPEGDGDTIVCATEADQGNLVPMELMKRLLKAKGLHQAVMFHDVRWGGEHRREGGAANTTSSNSGHRRDAGATKSGFLWVLLNSGSCGAYAFNHDPGTLRGVHSYRQPKGYFPVPGGTFTGESLPGAITWARAYLRGTGSGGTQGTELWMDIGRGEALRLPAEKREAWWRGTTREWPFMAADLGIRQETLMAHYLSNHIAVAYGDIFEELVALSQMLGFRVRVLGAM